MVFLRKHINKLQTITVTLNSLFYIQIRLLTKKSFKENVYINIHKQIQQKHQYGNVH